MTSNTDDLNLAAEAAALSKQVQGLRSEVTTVDNKRKVGNLVIAFVLTLLILGTVVMGAVGYQVYDCTVDGGTCYERNTQNTGGAIETINLVTIYANECSLEHPNEPSRIRPCVEGKLAQK